MSTCACSFTNEEGNQIYLAVENTEEPGDVRIYITGPYSEQETILTRLEAERLYAALREHLEK